MNFSGISVILPVYLRAPSEAPSLLNAVESVAGQDSPIPLELVVVNDGSPVDPGEYLVALCRSLDLNITTLPRNYGITFALNAGLSRAKYELIARIDADDIWRSGKIVKQLQLFADDADLTLSATAVRLNHPDPSRDRDHTPPPNWPQTLEYCAIHGSPFPHASVIARRDIYDLLGGYSHAPDVRFCEDFDLWCSWIRFFKTAVLQDVLLDYTVWEDQISTQYSAEQGLVTRALQRGFREKLNYRAIPAAMATVADHLDLSLLETGKIVCCAWRYFDSILADPEIEEAVQILLPERRVHRLRSPGPLPTGRPLYLGRDPLAGRLRGAHDTSHLAELLSPESPSSMRPPIVVSRGEK